MAHVTIQEQFFRIPPVTRWYTTACVVTTILTHLDLVTPFQLYYNPSLIFRKFQIWRLFTTFLYFGSFGFNFLFNLIFTYRYCRMLEENHYHGKTADFLYMFIFGGILIIRGNDVIAVMLSAYPDDITGVFVQILFLGQAFTIMLVYVWARRNPLVRMNFFGLFNFQAPYLPWVLLGFSLLLGNSVAVDVLGIAIGHIYYYLEDVFPRQPGGFRILKTPWILKYLFDQRVEERYEPLPEERPGGFQWGQDVPNQPGNDEQPR